MGQFDLILLSMCKLVDLFGYSFQDDLSGDFGNVLVTLCA